MDMRYIAMTAVFALIILFFVGGALSENCVDIQGCKQCWKTGQVAVTSELCPGGGTCTAQPRDQQNNAIVDAVLCACAKAKNADYADNQLNRRIEETISLYTGYNTSAGALCEQPGLFLVKNSYG